MIILHAFDPMARVACLRRVPGQTGTMKLSEVESCVDHTGLRDFHLRLDSEFSFDTKLGHTWEMEGDTLRYQATFPHKETSGSWMAAYAAVTLATAGLGRGQTLMESWLTIYELGVNVLEHGKPQVENAEMTLSLSFESDRIVGVIEDQCERFDATEPPPKDPAALAQNKAPRGYGMILVKRMVSSLEHECTPSGNRLTFVLKKAVESPC